MAKHQRYKIREDLEGAIRVLDTATGFYRDFSKIDFYDGTVPGGGCEYANKLPRYIFRKAYAIIDKTISIEDRIVWH